MNELRDLYQEVILDHNKNPRNFRPMEDADRRVEGFNPLCGDHYVLYLKITDGMINDISFTGSGCAISKASASVMSSTVKGKSIDEAERLFESFHRLVKGELSSNGQVESLGKLTVFAGVAEFPARVKCASLAWHTLHSALSSNEQTVSTE
ncbi:MAG: SUF system NifU family Fe-S cluster assembly protein [Bacteroidetes bacterium]|nr:MAG: SUF system NifU family Fe-S cluster assembly protein [Bacteroidota bacterium]